MSYYLGVDVGGSKSHALIATQAGEAVGFGSTGTGSWEAVGYKGLAEALNVITIRALEMAAIDRDQISGAGMGMAGYDWPSQRQAHFDAVRPLGLQAPVEIVNDATLGIWAGTCEGWGISIVAGTGCNCRGLSPDRRHEGRVVGGAGYWSGETVGGHGIVLKAMQAVAFEWLKRGPATGLTPVFLKKFGAKDLDDLIEGVYLRRYQFKSEDVLLIFEQATLGEPAALEAVRWAGEQLGQMAWGVINQLDLHSLPFEVVLIGSLYDGHPLMTESLADTIHRVAPLARLVRLNAPPVVGGVLLGMAMAGVDPQPVRMRLIESTRRLLGK